MTELKVGDTVVLDGPGWVDAGKQGKIVVVDKVEEGRPHVGSFLDESGIRSYIHAGNGYWGFKTLGAAKPDVSGIVAGIKSLEVYLDVLAQLGDLREDDRDRLVRVLGGISAKVVAL